MKTKILLLIVMCLGLYACSDVEPVGQTPIDGIAPKPVSDVSVENIPGGAILSYTLPGDEDLLYVKAVYYRKKDGKICDTRSSLYLDTLRLEGFGDTSEREVALIAVDRSKNESTPVKVKINPLTAPVTAIGATLEVVPDFGGIQMRWKNENRAKISIVVLKKDHNNEYNQIDVHYTSLVNGKYSTRGLDTISYDFEVYAEDRWENRSEPLRITLTPIFEALLDRRNFKEVQIPGNEPVGHSGWNVPNLWNGIISDNDGFHTVVTANWPQSFTFDMGVKAKISRMKFFQRQPTWIYRHGNIKKWEVWGTNSFALDGSWDSWEKLMDGESIKPSGRPIGDNTDEDRAAAAAGDEVMNNPDNKAVQFIRVRVTESWGGNFMHISEIQIWGDNRPNQ